jgi:DNA repair exonuclease SbcCD ATPase subunit
VRPTRLEIENFRGLRYVDIRIDKNVAYYVISGANGAGKSSVVDALYWAVVGTKGHLRDVDLVRAGADTASVRVELEGEERTFIVERRLSEGGKPELSVTAPDGARYPGPQTLLNKFVGEPIGFDPLAFCRESAKEQRETLLRALGLHQVYTAIEARRRATFDMRAEINREAKRLEGHVVELGDPGDLAPRVEVSLEEATARYQKALEAQNDHAQRLRVRRQCEENIQGLKGRIEQLRAEIVEREEQIRAHEETLRTANDFLAFEDEDEIAENLERAKRAIATLQETNKVAARAREYDAAFEAWARAKTDSAELTKAIEMIEQEKVDAIQSAKLPVEGLEVSDDDVLWKGISLASASFAERLTVAIGVAMAMRPAFKVIRIEQGGELDHEHALLIDALASLHGYLVLVERVQDFAIPGTLFIREGEISDWKEL